MANELVIDCGVYFVKSGAETIGPIRKPSQSITVAGTRGMALEQNIGTSWEQLDVQSIASVGWVYFENLGPTNYVELALTTGGTPFARIAAGIGFPMPVWGSTIWAKANSAAIILKFIPFEQ